MSFRTIHWHVIGGEPFNLNFLNFEFVGPLNSYLGYKTKTRNFLFDDDSAAMVVKTT